MRHGCLNSTMLAVFKHHVTFEGYLSMIIEMFERGGYFQHAKMSLTTLNYHMIVEIFGVNHGKFLMMSGSDQAAI